MTITASICTSFRSEMLQKIHNVATDTFKIALYTTSATLSVATTVYSATNEITNSSGSAYTAGGKVLAGNVVGTSGSLVYVTFTNPVWTNLSAANIRGALIYNSSASNKAVATLDFGAARSPSSTNFTIQFPTPTADNALIIFP